MNPFLLLTSLSLAVTQAQNERGPEPVLPAPSTARTEAPARPDAGAATPHQRPSAPGSIDRTARRLAGEASASVAHRFEVVHVDQPREGEVWVRGRTYKASFDATGACYIPFLGSDAPRNHPIHLALESVRVGGEPLPLAAPTIATGDDLVVLDRGPVSERYLLSVDQVEQTFVFEEPLSGPVDVRVSVDTELVPDDTADARRFGCDRGGVQIGAAFAVDSAGARTPLSMTHDPGGYTIHLAAEVVARATFPLTIDPIISTFSVDTFSASLTSPDVAFIDALDLGLIVYTEDFSSTDSDVYSALIDSAGNVTLNGYVDATTERWFSQGVGAAQGGEMFLVAAIADAGTGTEGSVMGRRLDPATTGFGTPFRIDDPVYLGPKSHLSVGGDPFDRFLVVWRREFSPTDRDVHARVVREDGTLVGSTNILLDNSFADYTSVTCSRHNGTLDAGNSRWAVVADRDVSGVRTLEAAEVLWTGEVEEPFYSLGAFSEELRFADVSAPLEIAGPKRFMVSCSRDYGSDIDLQTFVLEDGGVIASRNLSLGGLPGSFLNDEFPSCIETNDERFIVVWRDGDLGNLDASYVSTLVLLNGGISVAESALIEPEGVAADADAVPLPPAPVSGSRDYLIVWEDETSTGSEDIQATLYNDYATPLGLLYCNANPNSFGIEGRTYLTGTGDAGAPLTLHAVQLPPNQFGIFVCSQTAGFVIPPGSLGPLCLGGSIGRFSAILNSGPSGEFSLVADTNMLPEASAYAAATPGSTWRFQTWHRDATPSGAPAANFTSATVLTFN